METKSALTSEQIKSFETKLKKLFEDEGLPFNEDIKWIGEIPMITDATKRLTARGQSKYADLINKIKSRTI